MTTIWFDENSSNNIDFSNKINEVYSCSESTTISISIQDYTGEGFKLSYMLQIDYSDSMPPSTEDSKISFTLTNSLVTKEVG